jgi:hypothetical protein
MGYRARDQSSMLDARLLSTTFTLTKRHAILEPHCHSNLARASNRQCCHATARASWRLLWNVDLSTPQSHNHQRIFHTNVVLHDCGHIAHELPRDVGPLALHKINPSFPLGPKATTLRLPHEHNDPIPQLHQNPILLVPIIDDNTHLV